jgi:2,3-bisphosphoglycerate-independent phosphoglycerate mutase
MIDPVTGGPHTYHTTNPVPLILVSEDDSLELSSGGALRDIAPTMLSALGQPQPAAMTGRDLRTGVRKS